MHKFMPPNISLCLQAKIRLKTLTKERLEPEERLGQTDKDVEARAA